jgi:hypothetical protein
MRRTLITFCVAAALALACAVSVAAAPGAKGSKLATVKLLSCSQADHSAVFQGRMTQVPDTDRMELRFTLLVRRPGPKKAETRLRVPGLGAWHRSKAGVGTFAWKQQLLNLAAGGSYRVRVDYRWLDADGAVIRSSQRRSAFCSQGDRLPDLHVQIAGVRPTDTAGVWRYWLRIGNRGLGPAGSSAVRLSLDGSVVDVEPVGPLDPGVWTRVVVRGPACESWVEAEVDPDNVVVESAEGDNIHHVACADLIRR